MKEIWKDIEGYEGLYQVSNLGRVKSLERQVWKKRQQCYMRVRERIIQQYISKVGYYVVVLCQNGRKKTYYVHRLVAKAFIPNSENKPEIDHINTIRTDNRINNLRWATSKENSNNPLSKLHISEWQKENLRFGKDNINSIPIVQLSMKGTYIRSFDAIADAERETGIDHSNISVNLKEKTCHAGGYRWMYLSDYEKGKKPRDKKRYAIPIIQFSKNGEFIKEWACTADVQRELGIHHSGICNALKGKVKTAGGFKWQYA